MDTTRRYHVRQTDAGWESGYYLPDGSWSPALCFGNLLAAMLHAASQNRRNGAWSK